MVKNLPAMQKTLVQCLSWQRSPGEGNGYPLQYSSLEKSMDRGAWWATVHEVTESNTTERLTLCFLSRTKTQQELHKTSPKLGHCWEPASIGRLSLECVQKQGSISVILQKHAGRAIFPKYDYLSQEPVMTPYFQKTAPLSGLICLVLSHPL